MSNDNNRVLVRKGAHQLTQAEIEEVAAAKLTVATDLPTGPISNPDFMLDQ
jgi:hypothetical protein